MKRYFSEPYAFLKIEKDLWFFLWFSLPVSLKLTSLLIILLLLTVIMQLIFDRRVALNRSHFMITPFLFFFLWQARELLVAGFTLTLWKELEQTLPLLVIPVIFLLSSLDRKSFADIAFRGMVTSLLPCSLFALTRAVYLFLRDGEPGHLFYHQLAAPWHPGAVYFSLYLLFSLIMAGCSHWMSNRPAIRLGSFMFLFLMLLLMASKLMVVCGVPMLVWQYRRQLPGFLLKQRRWAFAMLIILSVASLPFFVRLSPLKNQITGMIRTTDFRQFPEPNGLQLRLILLRFGLETLNEKQAWMKGTGMVNSQVLLDEKIVRNHMYIGAGIGTDTGYLHYNFHNQYLETLVRQGVVGLVLLMAILMIPFVAEKDELHALALICILLPLFFLTESVLERQAGMVFFCLVYGAWVLKYR